VIKTDTFNLLLKISVICCKYGKFEVCLIEINFDQYFVFFGWRTNSNYGCWL